MLCSFFLLVRLSHHSLLSLLVPGNKHDWIETFTHCAEWPQFMANYFCLVVWLTFLGFFKDNSHNGQQYTVAATVCCCLHRVIYRSVAASQWNTWHRSQYVASVRVMICFLEQEFFAWKFCHGLTRVSNTEFHFFKISLNSLVFELSLSPDVSCMGFICHDE